MQIFDRYTDLLQRIEQKGYPSQVLGHTPDGSPLVCIRTGGRENASYFYQRGQPFDRAGRSWSGQWGYWTRSTQSIRSM